MAKIYNKYNEVLFEDNTTLKKELAEINKFGLRDAYLRFADLQGADLEYADLQGADLEYADLQGAELECANLKDANLEDANLQGADLQWVKLKGANLEGAELQGANLQGVYLQGAYLQGANLQGAKLQCADLKGAYLEGAKFDEEIEYLKKYRNDEFKQKLIKEALKEDALKMDDWHTCKTTHCLAGWASVLSDSLELENKYPIYLIGWACLGDEWAKMFFSEDDEAKEFLLNKLDN